MLLLRGATFPYRFGGLRVNVSIHAPLARSNFSDKRVRRTVFVSIHAPLARSNIVLRHSAQIGIVSIHAPLARSNAGAKTAQEWEEVSIHAPLARSNILRIDAAIRDKSFQYMLLLRGATGGRLIVFAWLVFQYMLLLRGATCNTALISLGNCFNTCSSCEEQPAPIFYMSNVAVSFNTCSSCEEQREGRRGQGLLFRFNTCSSCEEQRSAINAYGSAPLFQYMLLLRGATHARQQCTPEPAFQYMLLLRGATSDIAQAFYVDSGFNTCSSCEEQLIKKRLPRLREGFNTCSSCEEQLYRLFRQRAKRIVSIHAPLARSN